MNDWYSPETSSFGVGGRKMNLFIRLESGVSYQRTLEIIEHLKEGDIVCDCIVKGPGDVRIYVLGSSYPMQDKIREILGPGTNIESEEYELIRR